jgi:hypothetical protein
MGIASNETKMSCRERGRAWLLVDDGWLFKAGYYDGAGVGPILWLDSFPPGD